MLSGAQPEVGSCTTLVALVLCLIVAAPRAEESLFEADSRRDRNSTMDIVVKEIERRPRASVLQITIHSVGSSVGSSFFLLCTIRQLARIRGGYRYIAKLEEHPQPGQMLVGFLRAADEPPANIGAELATSVPIDLEQFAPICDGVK